jgi:hypothetical protein
MVLLALALLAAGTASPSPSTGDVLGIMRSGDGSEWQLIDAPTRLGGKCKRQKRLVIVLQNGKSIEGYCWRQISNTDLISISSPSQSVMTIPASYYEASVAKP